VDISATHVHLKPVVDHDDNCSEELYNDGKIELKENKTRDSKKIIYIILYKYIYIYIYIIIYEKERNKYRDI